jgi:aryl-alcohol dehydrogenase-like predicted oxidoreductase
MHQEPSMTVLPKRTPGAAPTLALGAMNFGKRTRAAESERIVRRALERGIRVFDTANSYNEGASESILGKALGKDRDRVVLSTKVGLGPVPGRREGLSQQAMKRALEGSLERLGVANVDVYYLHVPDRTTPIEASIDGMKGLVDSGRVRAWGVCNYASWEILEMNSLADARGLARPVVTQLLYSPIHRQLDVEYFAFARRHPIHTSVYNVLAGGLLAGAHRFDAAPTRGSRFDGNAMYQRRFWTRTMFDRAAEVRELAASHGISPVDFTYAWLATRPGVDSILVGPATVEQLDQAIDALGRALPEDACKAMDALALTWAGSDTNYVR